MKGFNRGINFGGWISQYGEDEGRWETYLCARDFARVAEWGFDHARVPFDYPCVYKHGMKYLDRANEWTRDNKLALVLDLHHAEGYFFGNLEKNQLFLSPALQDNFVKLWTDIAEHFKGVREDDMIFELLNEIVEKTPDGWNALLTRTISAIHAVDKARRVMIGGRDYNSVNRLCELPDYSGDPRIVYTFHYYLPFPFTHQRAGWNRETRELAQCIAYPTPSMEPYRAYARYSGEDESVFAGDGVMDIQWLERAIQPAVRFREAHPNNDLYLGEFGAITYADMASRASYVRDVSALCKRYGFGRAMWAYTMSFDIVNDKREPISKELLRAATL